MNLNSIILTTGSHAKNDNNACVMEFVSLLAGETWSDHPECASESITKLAIGINDNGDQSHRDRLKELAPRIVGTRDKTKEAARAKFYAEFAQRCADKVKHLNNNATTYTAYYAYAARAATYAAAAATRAATRAATYATEFKKEIYDDAIETLIKCLEV
jgi:hypothetical protein